VSRSWHDVASLEQLEREGVVVTRVAGREIGVVLDPEGGPRAIRNRCPHMGAPLCRGSVRERETGSPGRYELDGTRVLHCPWHGWEFDLESGVCRDDTAMRAAVYPVRVEAGRVLVEG